MMEANAAAILDQTSANVGAVANSNQDSPISAEREERAHVLIREAVRLASMVKRGFPVFEVVATMKAITRPVPSIIIQQLVGDE